MIQPLPVSRLSGHPRCPGKPLRTVMPSQNRSAFADPVAKQPVPRMSKSLTSEIAIAPMIVFTSDGFDFASKLLKDRRLPRIYSAAEPALSDS